MVNPGKEAAATAALSYVEDNMYVGLGTGSTAKIFIEKLAQRVKDENLTITCAATSIFSAELAASLGLKVVPLDDVDELDINVDGADEVDPQLNGIKGGGAALFYEKIVAKTAKKNIWIVDPSKQSEQLGSFKLPIEVLPFGSKHVFNYLKHDLNLDPTFRLQADGSLLTTDSDNYIIDVDVAKIDNLYELADELIRHVGILEHGLFMDICDILIVGDEPAQIIERQN
ncbi:ribose 5-phosphate isomerase [Weissella uvarum]|uniref:ribose-5-phosphate isomerase RpiA n=1 Tax=Weissella uvarum TaxID=1479233 RepID=UPI00195F651D|nr:ribose-5-phosphate isomerase RpiA [Weissella uvarum]MBM7617430.1 ribose 5-phosphate isomerase [Weissella uvarum]MCM0595685.1 ribose-5-phosphate isomerase RpiA [Weissella uvarum]